MATPSAAQVFTGRTGGRGDNSGGAAILDKAPDFYKTAENLIELQRKEQIEAARQAKDLNNKWYNIVKGVEAGTVWDRAKEARDNMVIETRNELVNLMKSGANPTDAYSEAGKVWQKKKADLDYFVKSQQDAEKTVASYLSAINKGDKPYDKEYAAKWFEKMESLPVSEIPKYVQESSPIRVKVPLSQFLTENIGQLDMTIEDIGGYRIETKELTPDEWKRRAEASILNEKGEQFFLQGVEDGKWSTVDEMASATYKDAKNAVGEVYKKTRLSTSGSGSGSKSGGSAKLNFGFAKTTDPKTSQDVEYNNFSPSRAGTDDNLPAIQVRLRSGEIVDSFQPSQFVLRKDGGIEVGGVLTSKDDDGETAKEEVWVDYDTNAQNFEAHLRGQSAYDIFKEKNGGKITSQKNSNTNNTQPSKDDFDEVITYEGKRYGVKNGEYYELD